MSDFKLRTENLAIGYAAGKQPPYLIAEGLSLALMPGELVCLLGPNGAGKSTLMRTLAGLQPVLSGDIWLAEKRLGEFLPQELATKIGLVLTDRTDVGHLSVESLVALGRYPHTGWWGKLSEHDLDIVRWAIEATGASDLVGRNVSELSDGERQKVMIARALAQEPEIILLDEPTAFLDLPRRVEIMHLLRQLTHGTNRAILLSTHDLDLALRCADRTWLLSSKGDIRTGLPEALVLDGSLEATFSRDGIVFDPSSGAFRWPILGNQVVSLTGEGSAAVWTERALERVGFCVDRRKCDTDIAVEVMVQDGQIGWQLSLSTGVEIHESLESLLDAMIGLS